MNKYYVYMYSCDGKPFYIGKGCGKRSERHLKRVLKEKKTHNKYLDNTINMLISEGKQINIIKLVDGLTSCESYIKEYELIKEYGRKGIDADVS